MLRQGKGGTEPHLALSYPTESRLDLPSASLPCPASVAFRCVARRWVTWCGTERRGAVRSGAYRRGEAGLGKGGRQRVAWAHAYKFHRPHQLDVALGLFPGLVIDLIGFVAAASLAERLLCHTES